jgi:hypothetical protein
MTVRKFFTKTAIDAAVDRRAHALGVVNSASNNRKTAQTFFSRLCIPMADIPPIPVEHISAARKAVNETEYELNRAIEALAAEQRDFMKVCYEDKRTLAEIAKEIIGGTNDMKLAEEIYKHHAQQIYDTEQDGPNGEYLRKARLVFNQTVNVRKVA